MDKYTCNCQNVEFGSYDNQVELPLPAHMPSQRGVTTVCVDACLADEIQQLWALGITTTGCCCGHNKGDEYPYIGVENEDIEAMLSMGYSIQQNQLDPFRRDSFVPKSVSTNSEARLRYLLRKIQAIYLEAKRKLEDTKDRPMSESAIEARTCINVCNELTK